MSFPYNQLSGGPFGAAWSAFYRQGLWTPAAGFVTTADINNGDTEIRVNDLPNTGGLYTNLWEPIRSPAPGVPGSGFGKLLRIAPSAEDLFVEIRGVDPFLTDPGPGDIVVQLAEPVSGLAAPISSGAQIGMGDSPVLPIGAEPKKVILYGATHGFDDRGNAVGTSPGVDIEAFVSDNQAGPFASLASITAPSFVAPGSEPIVLNQATFEFPPAAWVKFRAAPNGGDGGDTIFSFFVGKSVVE